MILSSTRRRNAALAIAAMALALMPAGRARAQGGFNPNTGDVGYNPLLRSTSGAPAPPGFSAANTTYNPLVTDPTGGSRLAPRGPNAAVPGGGVGAAPATPYNVPAGANFFGDFNPFGYGAVGWGGNDYGYGYGYGNANPVGLSPYDEAVIKYQTYAENASRYELNNAQAAAAYQMANYYNYLINQAAAANYKRTTGIKPYYHVQTQAARFAQADRRAAARALLPRNQVIDAEGRVLWPAVAPTSPSDLAAARAAADESVREVVLQDQREGRIPVRSVVAARNTVDAYGRPALDQLRDRGAADAETLDLFLRSLDKALVTIGGAAPRVVAQEIKPEDAPRTGGDVLRQSIEQDKGEAPAPDRQPPTPATPRTGGDAAKDAPQRDRSSDPR